MDPSPNQRSKGVEKVIFGYRQLLPYQAPKSHKSSL